MSRTEEMVRALTALGLEAPAPVVADVREKVLAVYMEQEAKVDALRGVIAMWVREPHRGWCEALANNPCNCGADTINAARLTARKLSGLED